MGLSAVFSMWKCGSSHSVWTTRIYLPIQILKSVSCLRYSLANVKFKVVVSSDCSSNSELMGHKRSVCWKHLGWGIKAYLAAWNVICYYLCFMCNVHVYAIRPVNNNPTMQFETTNNKSYSYILSLIVWVTLGFPKWCIVGYAFNYHIYSLACFQGCGYEHRM